MFLSAIGDHVEQVALSEDTVNPGQERVGPEHFQLLKVLGKGGYGKVSVNTQYWLKVRDQITFFTLPTYLKVFEILVPIDGSYFSHSHPEIWHSKIGNL